MKSVSADISDTEGVSVLSISVVSDTEPISVHWASVSMTKVSVFSVLFTDTAHSYRSPVPNEPKNTHIEMFVNVYNIAHKILRNTSFLIGKL